MAMVRQVGITLVLHPLNVRVRGLVVHGLGGDGKVRRDASLDPPLPEPLAGVDSWWRRRQIQTANLAS